jgi:hypothetical protein
VENLFGVGHDVGLRPLLAVARARPGGAPGRVFYSSPTPGRADEKGMINNTPNRNDAPHHLDALVWDTERWCEQFEALLNAVEFQLALEDWLSEGISEDEN